MMWNSLANIKENLNQIVLEVQDATDGEEFEIYRSNSNSAAEDSPIFNRRISHRFAQSNNSPLRSPMSNGGDSALKSEIEKYKTEIQKFQASEAEIKALSVNYVALLKEKEEKLSRLHGENEMLRKNLEAANASQHASKNETFNKRNVHKVLHFAFIVLKDVRAIANRYAAQLQFCCTQNPISHSLAQSVHANIITSGFKPRGHILNRLIDIYCKSNNIVYARYLFDKIPKPDIVSRTTLISAYSELGNVNFATYIFDEAPLSIRDTVSYNAMITGFSHNNDGYNAVKLFNEMRKYGFKPDNLTFASLLSAAALVAHDERECKQLHCNVVKAGADLFVSVLNALISLYVKCGFSLLTPMSDARKLFDQMEKRDELSWMNMITGYVRNGEIESARELFDGMNENLQVAYNAMISGYVQHGFMLKALEMFKSMHLEGIELDEFTYTSVISGCANSGLFLIGKQVHGSILRTGWRPASKLALPVNNALVTLYCKCGKVDQARQIFDSMLEKDHVSWNAILSGYVSVGRIDGAKNVFNAMPEKDLLTWMVMISGFAQNGYGEDALKLFDRMRTEGLAPCDYSFAGAITACASLGALEHGRQLHAQLIQLGFNSSLSAGNALITMYARCGVVEAAHVVFHTMPYIDSVSWNSMITALGQHGHGLQALKVFDLMLQENIKPDRITFLIVLTACSHSGLVKEGCRGTYMGGTS
ncbi:hypothetical protein MKW98_024053 [Papaver atlanticum]|uniref:Pentatricopeptide repeat-containing protein n=1 Tax=Papaver atlanticum TaxID=357466 RepID=A0AAD4SY41_9MAGN|nr:hypothetical protein MKW98_024053 [Papaver atlanticum]